MNDTEIESFFGVYLLYCMNIKYKGRTYIGYTVNPKRRIKQHNAGQKFGGAWRTSNRGPWNMILIIHGFPSSTAALRFEWAWQHPHMSRRLRHLPKKSSKQKTFDFVLMVLSEMLNVGPWNRLPLTVRWLDDEFGSKFREKINAPLHMPVVFGKVTSKKLNQREREPRESKSKKAEAANDPHSEAFCSICRLLTKPEERVACINPRCPLLAHLGCLAAEFTKKDGMILPLEGDCPSCGANVLWGDLIRKKIGCNLHLEAVATSDSESDD